MTANFKRYYNGRLPLSTVPGTRDISNQGPGELKNWKDGILENLYFLSQEERKTPESFRQQFIRKYCLSATDNNKCRHYFTWHFIERFSLQDIMIVTDQTAKTTGGELWACFALAATQYRTYIGYDESIMCGETEFIRTSDWFAGNGEQNEFVENIGHSEPLQYCFELYLELIYGSIDDEIRHRLQYGTSDPPFTANDFILQVKNVIGKKGL